MIRPRQAATVVLLRDGDEGVEVFLLRRVRAMAFAAGMTVFPGGSVDPADGASQTPWVGRPPPDASLVCAAVRETFEESGVLLAAGVKDTSEPDWEADRVALCDGQLSLAQLLTRRGLSLRADALFPWSHWITPESEPRRYDTYFFAATLPSGQSTRDIGGEADRVSWQRPADALADTAHSLLPPTLVTLRELATYDSVAEALATERNLAPIMPLLEDGEVVLPDGTVIPLL